MVNLTEQVTRSLEPLVREMGFKKRVDGIFTNEPAPGFLGWLGLNHARRKGGIEINPVVGVRSQQLERKLSDLLGEKAHPYNPPTVSISLGYLMPDATYRAWIFEDKINPDLVSELAGAFRTYALPFIGSSISLKEIALLLESPKYGHTDHVMYRRPLVHLLLDDAETAIAISEMYLERMAQRTDMASERFRNFAKAMARAVHKDDGSTSQAG